VLGGKAIFGATDGNGDGELWRTDGTTTGTRRIKDIVAGAGSSYPDQLVTLGAKVCFSASTDATGDELWRTDGTKNGTKLVKDINPGTAGSNIWEMTRFKTMLVFRAQTAARGQELWRTDCTKAGTRLIKDLEPGAGGSSPSYLTPAGGRLFFLATVGGQQGLYVTNGTATGTKRLGVFTDLFSIVAVGDRVYFLANDGSHGLEPWTSDGTKAGTKMVKDINVGPGGSGYTVFAGGSAFWFGADNGTDGAELWRATGPSTAKQVKDINVGPESAFAMSGGAAFGNKLIFSATDATSGIEPWISGGTAATTKLLKNIDPD
jgi:ELWxxDGT repeat protein